MNTTTKGALRLGTLLLASALALTGCAGAEPSVPAPPAPTSDPASADSVPVSDSVTITDAWVKAADDGMTAAFGQLRNDSGTDATVTAVASPASTALELHETVEDDSGQMVMRKVEQGFVIPAGGTLLLEPGGDHIMLMGLTAPLLAGEEATFTLTFSDGSQLDFAAPVKDYAGANESYEHDHGDHEQGDHEHDEHAGH